jgi:hypothetical protein
VTVRAGGHEASQTVRVLADPRAPNTEADWQARWAAIVRLQQLRQAVVEAVERLRRARADLAALGTPPPAAGAAAAVARDIPPIEKSLAGLEARLILPPRLPIGVARHDLRTRLFELEDALTSGMAPPSPAQAADLRDAEAAVAGAHLI